MRNSDTLGTNLKQIALLLQSFTKTTSNWAVFQLPNTCGVVKEADKTQPFLPGSKKAKTPGRLAR